jgi:hypothetical protein
MNLKITYNLNIHSYKYIITMTSITNDRNNYIILTNNIIDSSNVGSLLYIKTNVTDLSSNRTDASWQNILQNLSPNTYKNRIIVSGKINNTSCCLITQNNIKNNMKFIFDSSTNKNGKILFVKNLDSGDNSYNYLFNDLSNTFFEKTIYSNINNSLTTNISNTYNRYIHHLNYYFSNSDMYQINIRDFLYKYRNYRTSSGVPVTIHNTYTSINYTITDISNDFYFNNTTIDSSSIINFKSSNFTTLLIDNSGGTSFINDTSFTILQKNTSYSIVRNILSYNKLTLDYKHVNYYDFSLGNATNSFYTTSLDNSINIIKTFLIKTNNFQIIKNIKNNSKIIFGLKNVYLYNVKVLDYSSNLYIKPITFNNQPNKTLKQDFSNTMFLGLGDRLTGITQNDIYNHIKFSTNSNNKSIIKFKKNINTQNITSNSNYAPLIPNLSKYYLLDICLNYAKNSISHNINNTINYNIVLYNNIVFQIGKIFDINIKNYFDASTNNIYKNSFNNLAKINNISGDIYSTNYELVNSAINVEFKNFITSDLSNIKINNLRNLIRQDEITLLSINSDLLFYDLRYNYNKTFYVFNNLNIHLSPNSINLKRYLDLDILNFYSLTFANFVKTTSASDFTNVDCIYIYHDPINDPDEKFRYPNNNIEIKRDSEIDTLSKAIEQYRGTGARTSTTNAVFIPAQNGSNLSRKMIQGLVGLNNVPKLLSIEPYDPNFTTGRGFINQYQIDDACITSNCDKIAVKQNSIKHDSVKNKTLNISNTLKKQNFANIVKSNKQNKLSQECINNNTTTNNVVTLHTLINDPNCDNTIKYTPFILFQKGKGKYL